MAESVFIITTKGHFRAPLFIKLSLGY